MNSINRKQFLSKLLNNKKPNKFINFYCDFETVVYENKHYVTCYSIVGDNYTASNIIKLKTSDEINEKSKDLVLEFINKCLNLVEGNKRQRYLFFFHNLNRFDSYFILSTLSNNDFFDIKIISRNNQVYKIIAVNKNLNLTLEFRDSLLYLPLSLTELSTVFCNKHQKLSFNIEDSSIDTYLTDDPFQKNLIKYCLSDSLTLQEGFEAYLHYIRTTLKIEPLNSLSLPGLSLRYFRSNFYNDKYSPIERLSTNKDNFIRKSYRGGTVELFKPYLKDGFHYDVNSLYPYVMKSFDMPIGIGKWVDISTIDNFFGFVKVEVTSPEYDHKPFLNYYDEKLGLITPIGKWVEVYFSEEIKYALTLGYKFKYLKGLSYDRSIIFDKFVDSLYTLRLTHPKGSPLNTITKLLLNSLYGRFGMRTQMLKSKIINNTDLKKYVSSYDVVDISTFEYKSLITFLENSELNKLNLLLEKNYINLENYKNLTKQVASINESSAVQIASAITAYARIYIDRFKRDPSLDVYYSDTDSIFCQNPLAADLISNTELGKFKLENRINEAIFLLPKVYMLKTVDDKTIIKCKGLNNQLLTDKDIYNIFFNSENIIKKFVSHFRRDFKKFTISKQQYDIRITSNLLKRNKVIKDGKWVDTSPLKV